MNVRQRIAHFLNPIDTRALETIGTALRRAIEENTIMREQLHEGQQQRAEIAGELRESAAMAYGRWLPGQQEVAVHESGPTVLKERLWDLEIALEDRGWQQQIAQSQTEFSRWGIQQIILMCRLYKLKNPLVSRGISVSAIYVFGRGVEISSDDKTANDTLKAFLGDPRNERELGHVGLVEKEETLHTDGNVFLVLFTAPDTGGVIVRTVDCIEIEEIVCDPNDSSVPWFYHRRWIEQSFDLATGNVMQTPREAWYADLGYTGMIPARIKGIDLMKDAQGKPVPMMHEKAGGLPKWQFGCPLVYAAIDWARAYKHYLEDWATRQRALARFAWDVETKGGAPALAALKATFETTLASGGYGIETNPTPVTGSMFGHDLGTKAQPMKTAGSMDTPEAGRRIGLMVCSALGLPETMLFGDVSVGTLATATSLDEPTRLKFLFAQERWKQALQRICRYVLQQSATAPKGRLRESVKKNGTMPTVDVDFPSILDPDIPARIGAVVNALTLGGHPVNGIDEKTGVTLMLQELGVEDVQAVVDAMYPEATYEMDRTLEPEVTVDPVTGNPIDPAKPNPKKAPKVTPKEAKIAVAVAELRRAVIKLQERV